MTDQHPLSNYATDEEQKVEDTEDFGGEVPDANYQVRVDAARMTETHEEHKPMIVFEFEIEGPKYKSRKIWDNNVMGHPVSFDVVANKIHKIIGRRDWKWTQLGEVLNECLDKYLEIRKYTNKDGYQNINVIKVIDYTPGETPESDDIPF